MRRLHFEPQRVAGPSRREFLLAGGAVVSTLSLARVRPTGPKQVSNERDKLREIMQRYGSELGNARYFDQE
jgi:hypothetical protein